MNRESAQSELKTTLSPMGFTLRIWGGRRFGWLEAGFLAVVIIALVMRLWELGGRTAHYDEAIHLHFSWKLAESGGAFLGWPWIFGTDYFHSPWMHGPFQIEFTALIFRIFGDTDVTARLGYVLFGTGLVAVPFFFRHYLGRTGALMAAVMLTFSPTMLYFSRFGRNDIIMAFFASTLLILMWRYINDGHRRYLYLASGILALMFATKETAYLIVAIFGLILFLVSIGDLVPWALGRTKLSQVSHSAGFFLLLVSLSLPQWSALSGIFQNVLGLTLTNPDPQTGANIANVDGTVGLVGAPAWEGKTLLLPVHNLPIEVHALVIVAGLSILTWLVYHGGLTSRRIACIGGAPVAITFALTLLLYTPISNVVETRDVPALDLSLAVLMGTAAICSLIYYRYPFQRGTLLLFIPILLTTLYAVLFTPLLDLDAVVNGILPSQVTIGPASNGLPLNYVVALGILSGTIILSAVLGIRWLGSTWLICAGIFYFLWSVLYTTFFTNMAGVFSGSWQGMGYWVAQQDVARGNQPWYYYFVGLPVYELLPLAFGIAGGLYFFKRGDILGMALTLWAALTFLAYTIASEKMPWLLVNITLPLIFLSAKFLGELAESVRWNEAMRRGAAGSLFLAPLALLGGLYFLYGYTDGSKEGGGLDPKHYVVLTISIINLICSAYLVRRTASANGGAIATIGLAVLLLGFSTWGAIRAAYTFDDSNREILVYAQGGSDLQYTFTQFNEQVFSPKHDSSLVKDMASPRRTVEVDYDVWYPFQWYVRNAEADGLLRFACFKKKSEDGWNPSCNSLETPLDDDAFKPTSMMLTAGHSNLTSGELQEYQKSEKLHSLLWFPETYRRPGESRKDEPWKDEFSKDLEFFKDVVTSKEAWRNALGYWVFRDLEQDWFTGDYYTFTR